MDLPPVPPQSPTHVWLNPTSLTRRRDTYPFIDPFRFRGSLTRRLVLIANAHRGIGRATALDFASAGATVVCTARTTQELAPILADIRTRYNIPAFALAADFSDPSIPTRLIQHIEQTLGPVDILVNICMFTGLSSFAHEQNFLTDWWQTLEQNVRAPVALIHAVLPSMIARGSGVIITTTLSSGALTLPFQSAESTSRAAMIRFHHGLDKEMRPKGIYSYVVNPGPIASYYGNKDVAQAKTSHFAQEPRLQTEITSMLADVIDERGGWCSAGLASGTFLALCAEPRTRVLSGLYVNAERDLEEVITEIEKGEGNRVQKERLYMLKVDEL